HEAAQGYYEDLVTCLDALGRGQAAAGAREKLGAVLQISVRYDAALAVLEQAAAAYGAAGDQERLARTLGQIGWAHMLRGTAEEGLARLQAALERLDTGVPSAGLAALYFALALLYHHSHSLYRECLATAERAEAMARTLDDEGLLAWALHHR